MSLHKKECPVHLLGTVTIGPKGQVVIPVEARDKMGLIPGDKLIALYVTEKKSIAFVPEAQLESVIEKMATHIGVLKDVLNK